MALEPGVSVLAFGDALDLYFAKFALPPGAVGLAMPVCFATLPWVKFHSRFKPIEDQP